MPPDSEHDPFPVRHVTRVEERLNHAWLVEPLCTLRAAIVIGGTPKTCKTWLGCELALAVATGAPALGRFAVPHPGTVLFYGAEDSQPTLRARFEGIARARGLSLEGIPLYLLDVTALRIDRADHLARLRATIAEQRPVLVVLDPFVRLTRVDENSAAEVSAVLGDLRAIQRELETTILLAHHARKSPSGHKGYQLRGSSDFAAWHDSALYLSGCPDDLDLHVEHRSAPAPDPLHMRLIKSADPHLAIVNGEAVPERAPEDALEAAILERLTAAHRPLSSSELRDLLRARKQSVTDALARLARAGRVRRCDDGWVLAP